MGTVTLHEISKSYNSIQACSDISLTINRGEFFTFLGPSGCGKTTLLRLIAGFLRPDNGAIFLDNVDIKNIPPEKRSIGMVFQNYALFPFLTVAENIAYGLKVAKKTKREITAKVDKYLGIIGLPGYQARNVTDLSGGEQQRVALARSLVTEPQVLLLDEPLSNLDARLRLKMRDEIKTLQQQLSITTIFVTHDQTEALAMSDRLAVFHNGTCIQEGSPEAIYNTPANSFVAGFIGDINLFPVECGGHTIKLSKEVSINSTTCSSVRFAAIRPQHIIMRPAASTLPNLPYHLYGEVTSMQHNGTCIDYKVQVKDLTFKVTTLNAPHEAMPVIAGQRVCLSFAQSSLQLLTN